MLFDTAGHQAADHQTVCRLCSGPSSRVLARTHLSITPRPECSELGATWMLSLFISSFALRSPMLPAFPPPPCGLRGPPSPLS